MSAPDTPDRTPDKSGTVSIIPRLRLHAGLPVLSSWLPVVRPQPAEGEEGRPAKP
jgi:hypothetical protein